MRFSIKSLLLITAMLPISVGLIATVEACADTLASGLYRSLFPKSDDSWDQAFYLILRNSLGINGSSTLDRIMDWAPCVLGWIAVACMNVLLVWTRHKHFALLSAASIIVMPLYGMLIVNRSPEVIAILGPGKAYFSGALAGIIGSSISAITAGAVVFFRSRFGHPIRVQSESTQEGLRPSVVIVISFSLFLMSMYGWWLINA